MIINAMKITFIYAKVNVGKVAKKLLIAPFICLVRFLFYVLYVQFYGKATEIRSG